MITLVMPWPSPKLSPNARVHWAVLAREKKHTVNYAGGKQKPKEPCQLKQINLKLLLPFTHQQNVGLTLIIA